LGSLIPVSETQPDQPAYLDQAIWRQMQEASTLEAFMQSWLSLQCTLLKGVRRGVAVTGAPDRGPYSPVAFWPEGKGGSLGLTAVTELAIEERRGVLRDPEYGESDLERRQTACHIAYPFLVDGRLHGVVAIELAARAETELRAAMRNLQWGLAWVEIRLQRTSEGRFSPTNKRLSKLLDLVSACVEKERFQDAATTVVTELSSYLGCELASLGFLDGRHIKVRALSHSAQFAPRSSLVESIGSAMDEAMDQRSTLLYPPPKSSPVRLLANHAKLARAHGGRALCTVPLSQGGRVIGALTFERPADVGFDLQTVEFCEAVAAVVGPILDLKRREDRWVISKIADSWRTFGHNLTGHGHLALKLSLAALGFLALFFSFATGPYRIAADTRIEGSVQRVVVAPLNGYVVAAPLRAGDLVRQGELIAKLDDRELLLERAKWASQREQRLQEFRDALAKSSRGDIAVIKAQLGQSEAELALVAEKLARTRLVAPFAGVIVSGDLTQSLGAPVAQGDVLFKVAPLDAYRVILEVDERDMSEVEVGKTGRLVLTGESAEVLPFHVEKITLVSETREGRNFFRVEAKLEQSPKFLRPGMKGVGKIDIGQRKLIWIWTRGLIDWLKLALWSYLA
jgi:multidrug resistance efflux pump